MGTLTHQVREPDMHRTQISLKQEQYRRLRAEAQRKGISLSGLIRSIVDDHFVSAGSPAQDPLDALGGIGLGTGDPVGREHNPHLYGARD